MGLLNGLLQGTIQWNTQWEGLINGNKRVEILNGHYNRYANTMAYST